MLDSKDSTVTYMEVSSPFENLSDIGSSRVDGLPMMLEDPYAYVEATLQALPSPDYVPGPEHPPSPAYVPEFVPEHVYQEFMPPEDDVLLAEEQPLPTEDPEEDDIDSEEDPANYPTNREDDGDESSEDEIDNEEEDEDENKEDEEEHPSSTNSVLPPVHYILSPPLPISSPSLPTSLTYPLAYRVAMIRLRAESPSISHPPSPILLPHTRASMAMLRATTRSTYILAPQSETSPSGTPPLLHIPLPASSPPLLLPSTSHRANVLEVTLPPQKRLCIALGLRFDVGESSSAPTARPTGGFRVDHGFVGTLNDVISVGTSEGDYRIADNKPYTTDTASRGTDSAKDTTDTCGSIIEMAGTR
nr:hypothetical protein [Tanacetum cinerariifolium]